MFTWICPKCGSEVPPSYSSCPNCEARQKAAAQALPQTAPPPIQAPLPESVAPPPATPKPRSGLPSWLAGLLVFGGLAGGLAVLYLYVLPAGRGQPQTPQATFEKPADPASQAAAARNPLAKHLEISGLRLTEDRQRKAQMRFVVINHSAADLPELKLRVSISAGDRNLGEFPFSLPSLGPYDSREFTAALSTKLREYEVPDWQFLKASFQVAAEP